MNQSELKTLEVARQAAQESLDIAKNAKERNVLGQFATPSELAIQMAELGREVLCPDEPIRFLDPSLGSGVFFYAARKVFGTRLKNAAGIEVDPAAAAAARKLWAALGLDVRIQDFCTTMSPQLPNERANLILCNPPYVRHHHLGRAQKERLRKEIERAGFSLSGLSGLYCYFLLLADRWMAPEGIAIWIVPAEFLDVNYGKAIKRYLTNDVTLLRVHRFDPQDMQFDDALVSSVILLFRKTPPRPDSFVDLTSDGKLHCPQMVRSLPLRRLMPESKWGQLFSRVDLEQHRADSLAVGDLFTVKRGLATGANSFFILPRRRAAALGIAQRFLRPILPSPREIRECLIDSGPDGFPIGLPQLVLLDCNLPVDKIRDEFPALAAYLEYGEREGIPGRYLAAHRQPWYSQEHRPPAPILCTYMGRSSSGRGLRFIRNKSQATAPNVYLLLYPKPQLATLLIDDPKAIDRLFTALDESGCQLVRRGRVYGGGLNKIEPKELEALRLPCWVEREYPSLGEFQLVTA